MSDSVARFPRRLSLYTAALFLLACALTVAVSVRYGPPSGTALLIFVPLSVFGVHRSVVVTGDGADFSPNVMIFMAAIVVLAHDQHLGGAVIVGFAGGLFFPALRRSTWGWVVFNASVYASSVGIASLVYEGVGQPATRDLPLAMIPMAAPAIACLSTMCLLTLLSYAAEGRGAPRSLVLDVARHNAEELPFAYIGFFLGRLYISLGWEVLLLIIVPILIAREMFASYIRVKESHEETVGMLIRALEAKDRYTAGHAERVANYARYMGEELNFMPARLERLRFAALMHDIGKLVVPNQLLNKPGRLTPEEFAQVRIHEKVSVQMLSHIDFLRPIAGAAHSDNTKFDPDDEDHPIEPYIVMIADAYDAMTSTRSYRKALPQDTAFQELRDKAGIQFHPECVEALIRSIETRGEKHGAGFEEQQEFVNAPDAGLGSAGLGDLLPSDSRGA